jgi:hypothetical protein
MVNLNISNPNVYNIRVLIIYCSENYGNAEKEC